VDLYFTPCCMISFSTNFSISDKIFRWIYIIDEHLLITFSQLFCFSSYCVRLWHITLLYAILLFYSDIHLGIWTLPYSFDLCNIIDKFRRGLHWLLRVYKFQIVRSWSVFQCAFKTLQIWKIWKFSVVVI
jgi:hypothetical protein